MQIGKSWSLRMLAAGWPWTITPLLAHPEAVATAVRRLAAPWHNAGITAVAAVEEVDDALE